MAKYDPLRDWLKRVPSNSDTVKLSFAQIGEMVGGLPLSARKHQAWWSNSLSHPEAIAWRDAGFEVAEVDQRVGYVIFRRS
jgi:hypothetical protein